MKKTLLLFVIFYINLSFGQRVNLDRESFSGISFIQLPSNPIMDPTKRTFSANNNHINIVGFKRLYDEPGTIDVKLNFNPTFVELSKVTNKVDVKKDKNGKVISKTYTYFVEADYKTTGTVYVKNNITGDIHDENVSQKSHFKSQGFRSYSQAQRYYNDNKYSLKGQERSNHIQAIQKRVRGYLNSMYGYPIMNARDFFWILGRKKHPEYKNHRLYYTKAKAIFAKIKAEEPIEDVKKEFQPIIDYFLETAKKYQGDKKRMRKMRYASYYNIAKIYLYLDMPEKVKEFGNKIVENDYDKRDGKRFIKKAEHLERMFGINKVKTRHFKIYHDQ